MIGPDGAPRTIPPLDQKLRFAVSWEASKRVDNPTFGFSIADEEGKTVFGSNTEIVGCDVPFIEGRGTLELALDASSLHAGNYILSFSLHSRDHRVNYHRLENHLPLCLAGTTGFDGVCRLPCQWSPRA